MPVDRNTTITLNAPTQTEFQTIRVIALAQALALGPKTRYQAQRSYRSRRQRGVLAALVFFTSVVVVLYVVVVSCSLWVPPQALSATVVPPLPRTVYLL